MGKFYRLNKNIQAKKVRLLDESNKQIGVFSIEEALVKAESLGVDLVEIAPKAVPSVCKLIDFKKFKYQEKKRERELRKKAKAVGLKQIRLRPFIGEHDFKVRAQKAREFLTDGHRVKVTVQFYGRQISRKEFGYQLIDRLKQELKDIASLEQPPRFHGKRLESHFSVKKRAAKDVKQEGELGKNHAKDENKKNSS